MIIYAPNISMFFTAFSGIVTHNQESSQRSTLLRTRAMSSQCYDVIVVGGGAIGLGAAYEVAKAGKSTLVLEQGCFSTRLGAPTI